MDSNKPIVMCFSGLDPTGGAGIQADIETLFSIGCHCTPVVTAITAQNTQNAISCESVDATMLIQQARAVLEDMPVRAFKIGLLADVESVEVLHTLFTDYPGIPVVLDPVAVAGGGFELADAETLDAIRTLLLPLVSLITPNTEELMKLAPTADTLDACASELLDSGCEHILVTGTHAQTDDVINKLYSQHQEIILFNWPRLANSYHGAGCTLAAAASGYLAHGLDIHEAVQQAQKFTWESLSHGERMGFGQLMPDRSYWSKQKS